jgi:anti-sigma regulatory factor (Ser/Thr protein kinase)
LTYENKITETHDDCVELRYDVNGDNFTSAGEASVDVKRALRELGFDAGVIRRVAIAMYEGEINMVIHAEGGEAVVCVYPDKIVITLSDRGPGIADIELAMQEGYSTAPDNVRALGFGAGMGLPNMKRYTDEMRIESALGEGTTIYMTVRT